ncbi:unnamed protein product [Caenorhabditis auriculariae]|uniref:Uncharacterized protein n=1 Tax=Caenorhabditis auriculariae TaxID=2777116 RepID=A0A8S1GN34_9PELO|nr:unnamed protein product [Caenorhabditis auriculariae]
MATKFSEIRFILKTSLPEMPLPQSGNEENGPRSFTPSKNTIFVRPAEANGIKENLSERSFQELGGLTPIDSPPLIRHNKSEKSLAPISNIQEKNGKIKSPQSAPNLPISRNYPTKEEKEKESAEKNQAIVSCPFKILGCHKEGSEKAVKTHIRDDR